MGLTYIRGTVSGRTRKRNSRVRFFVDSGVSHTLLPHKVWRKLGLKPKRTLRFTLADGTEITRKVSECHIRLPQGEGHTPVILGEPGDEPLLGAVTLEVLGLVLDPFRRSLRPMKMMLAQGR